MTIIYYSLDEPTTEHLLKDKCSFCFQPLQKGKFVKTADSPAICFSCVRRCSTLLKEDELLEFDDLE